ncbi:unnamed protein product [Blepharisma stoltei]|uniref:Uncharacterized protein n=1 Tax=Blepharisma stoltei TaxID=1481888 RepID=A0AAU9IL16_9CILI|nr:unnamed protein product [Blepharisma stoltei]
MNSVYHLYNAEAKRNKENKLRMIADVIESDREPYKQPSRSAYLEGDDVYTEDKDLKSDGDARSEPSSAKTKQITNINDPLIQTTPLSKPEPLFKRKMVSIIQNNSDTKERISGSPQDCNGECLSRVISKMSEFLLLKFQETLNIEKTVMSELISNGISKDDLLLKLTNKAEELNRENAILKLENKGLKSMLDSWHK